MTPDRSTNPKEGNAAEDAQIGADAAEAKQADAGASAGGAAGEPEAAPKRRRGRRARKAEHAQPAAEQAARPEGESAAEPPAAEPAAAELPAGEAPTPERPRRPSAQRATDSAASPAPAQARARKAPAARRRRRVVRARARYVRTPARKARMVCLQLPGKSVAQARAILAFTPREAARDWSKLLESAVANAENNHELLEEDLIIREAYADEGPTIKRFRPRAMGRATPIQKRTSHLTITLTARPDPTRKS